MREMRQKKRQITDPEDIFAVMKKCDSCSVAFFDGEYPYIIPLNFGVTYEDGRFTLYFHGPDKGTKLDLLAKNNHVAFEMDCCHELLVGATSCNTSMDFESVCGNGVMTLLSDEEKAAALLPLMEQYRAGETHKFDEAILRRTAVMRLDVHTITGKRHAKKSVWNHR